MGDATNSTYLLTKQSHWVKMAPTQMRNYRVLWGQMPQIARIYSVYAGQECHPVIYSSHYITLETARKLSTCVLRGIWWNKSVGWTADIIH